MSRKCVIYVAPTAEVGGAEKVLATLASHAAEWGFDALMVFMRTGPMVEEVKKLGVPTRVFHDHRFRNVRSVLQGRNFLRTIAAESPNALLHVNHSAHIYTSWAGKREIWQLCDKPGGEIMSWFLRLFPAENAIYASPALTGQEFFRIKHSKMILPCIGLNDVWAAVATEDFILQKLNLVRKRFFLSVGRIQSHKGVHVLLKAMAMFTKEHPDVKLCIVGKASGLDGAKYLARLKELCHTLGIEQVVTFAGFLTDVEVKSLMSSALSLVHPAISEGFGLVLLQAMSVGLPVLAADAEGPAVVIKGEETGLLVRRGDSQALFAQMLRLATDEELRIELSTRARAVLGTFSEYRFLEETYDFYDEVFARGH